MNLDYSPENLIKLKTMLKTKFPQLTDKDLNTPDGDIKDMLRMIEYKLRKSKKELRNIIALL